MKENLKFAPLHHIDDAKISAASEDELHWVLMRSLQNKVQVNKQTAGEKVRPEMKYGYEVAEHLFCEFFMPMKECVSSIRGKQIIHNEPAIPGMFFVRDTLHNIQALATANLGFELRFLKGRKYQEPVIIRDDEMKTFISAVSEATEVRFFSPDDTNLKITVGKRIGLRKVGGLVEGHVVSIRGSKRRWLRVCISNILNAHIEIDLAELKKSGQIIELLD